MVDNKRLGMWALLALGAVSVYSIITGGKEDTSARNNPVISETFQEPMPIIGTADTIDNLFTGEVVDTQKERVLSNNYSFEDFGTDLAYAFLDYGCKLKVVDPFNKKTDIFNLENEFMVIYNSGITLSAPPP